MKKKEKSNSTVMSAEGEKVDRDELADLLVESLNKLNKDGGKVAYFLDDQEDPSMITDWISTGSTLLDLAISNRENGGLPVGRMVELNGLEGSGKSLVAAHVIANTQKKGGLGVFIDTESAAAPEFWKAVGVDISRCAYVPLTTVEEIFQYMEHVIGTIRKANSNRLLTIVVDSLAAASCETEMESEHGKDGYNTSKSIIISKAMRKITNLIGKQRVLIVYTNQLRMNMSAMAFGDKYVVSGGKSVAYHCSVRVRLSNIGKIKKGDNVIGNECKAQVVKNRMGPPQRIAEFSIFFDSGIQDMASWLDFLKKHEIAVTSKGCYNITLGEEQFKLTAKEFVEKVNTDTEFKQKVYSIICNLYVMKYRNPNSIIDEDITVSTDEDSEVGKEVSEE